MSSREEIETSHKKALKSLDGEKRAAIKKAKGTKGKKAKEALAAVEEEYATKLKDLEYSYQETLSKLESWNVTDKKEENTNDQQQQQEADAPTAADTDGINPTDNNDDDEEAARERKLAKARKKKERQKEKEALLQKQIEEETANAGPSMRQIELEQIEAILTPSSLTVSEVEADGHCLYRAVAAQSDKSYSEIRKYFRLFCVWT
jgi:OTU domain-containing protein 6